MKNECDDCSGTLEIDYARGEGVCSLCSLVHPLMFNDVDSNASAVHGEAAQSGAVDDNGKAGTKLNPFDINRDWSGKVLSKKERDAARRRAWADRNAQRETDPMARQLVNTINNMFGADLAKASRMLANAAARKLTPAQEATRKTLRPSEQKRLGCPKTRICRKPKGTKGASDKQNLEIMALAIASIAQGLFHTAAINERALMEEYGISKAQFTYAKRTIMDHWKARISQGWAPAPHNLKLAAARADQLDIAVGNLVNALEKRFATGQMDVIMDAFWEGLTALDEPSLDGPLANVPINMVAACVVYTVLERFGLHNGNLSCVAAAVGLSGAGVKSRLQEMRRLHEAGELPGGDELFKNAEDDSREDGESSSDGVEE
jgi:hypothetical protein